MRVGFQGARTHLASGRFLFLALVITGCQTVGSRTARSASDASNSVVIVSPGRISRGEQAEAARLLASAQTSFQARRLPEALRTITDILDRFPAADVSGEALRLAARVEFELGAMERADEAAGR